MLAILEETYSRRYNDGLHIPLALHFGDLVVVAVQLGGDHLKCVCGVGLLANVVEDAMGGGDDHIGRQQGAATDEVVVALVVPRVDAHVPRHHSVVDREAEGRELLHRSGNLATLLIATFALATPVAAGQALQVGQGGFQRLEARGTHELHLSAWSMVALSTVHLLTIEHTRGRC